MNKYKKSIRQMFLMSIEKDIKMWRTYNYEQYYSPTYNDYQFYIDNHWLYLIGANDNKEPLLKYRYGIFIFDHKVWNSVRKMKKHIKLIDAEKKLEKQNMFLISALTDIEKSFVKEIRKEKLKDIGNA